MPAFIANLPLHPLVVHAVVVLVPLAVLTGIAVAVWPRLRRHYGWPTVALAAVATGSIPLATDSGEALRDRLEPDSLVATHAELGDQLLILVAPMAVVLAALVYLDWRGRRATSAATPAATPDADADTIPDADADATPDAVPAASPAGTARWVRPTTVVLAGLAVVLAVASAVQVVRIGDSGARAVWHDTQYVAPAAQGD
ncbi:DUF2231 domain-containing protein [Actinophytocola sp.]|uniref:DUF2231 domain-containing protein n=1 Tax=Actinophytocola sp. TaxID=1872138 RepID=UPI002EDA4971